MEKKKRLLSTKAWIYLIIVPTLIILLISYWYLNLPPEGYCQTENRRLTDRERIEKVVRTVLNEYPRAFTPEWPGGSSEGTLSDGQWFKPTKKVGDGDIQIMYKPSQPIPYRDMKEFFELNPSCCYVTQNYHPAYGEGGGLVSSWDRLTGEKSAIAVVTWKLRYIDNDGILQTEEAHESYRWMDNCGNYVEE